jgi:hypothetical protein
LPHPNRKKFSEKQRVQNLKVGQKGRLRLCGKCATARKKHQDNQGLRKRAWRKCANRIKELQPEASNRQIAKTLRVGETTIRRDTAPNGAASSKTFNKNNEAEGPGAPNGAPSTVSGSTMWELCGRLGDEVDQAAWWAGISMTSMPFWNLIPWTTFGNWFSPFNRRHVFAAALTSLNTMSLAVFADRAPFVRTVR